MKLVFILILISGLLAAFWLFDKVLRIQYEKYPAEWEDDGRPHGFFFVPAKSSSWSNTIRFLSWFAGNPEWTKNEPKAREYLFWYRILIIVWNLGAVLLFAIYSVKN